MSGETTGILLASMGGPERLEDVETYIRRLLSDPLVVRFPLGRFTQPFLARWIARLRAPRVRKRYRMIGGGSPLVRETRDLAGRVAAGTGLPVAVAMQYSDPGMSAALNHLAEHAVTRVVVVPLFPQYSTVSSEPILRTFHRLAPSGLAHRIIRDHHVTPGYIRTLADQIRFARHDFSPKMESRIIFTAHSIPVAYTRSGDPYIGQVNATVAAVMEELNHDMPHFLAYQSQVGPAKWHAPTLTFAAMKMGYEQVRQVVIVPVSFISENLETLYDLDVEFRDKLREEGVEMIVRTPAAGSRESYSDMLTALIRDAAGQPFTRGESTGGNHS